MNWIIRNAIAFHLGLKQIKDKDRIDNIQLQQGKTRTTQRVTIELY
ncbi:hypothetical protein H6F98_03625 [Microcoleus sp. FACHB-SPT15]|nr:hypothetical protein [Microcoleus sp. FACHB-SPT15]MBD1804563.1 hypothetical protein [Microcoleus sp. FACHB-SPT15]